MVPIPEHSDDGSEWSGPVAKIGGSPAFQTTLEVTKGAALVYTIGERLLGSLAGTRIDTHAFTVCLKIGSALHWSVQGQNRFYTAKDSLISVPAWSKLFTFGFNWNGPLGDILKLEDGARFAALTACLLETYTAHTVSQIYIQLFGLFKERKKENIYIDNVQVPSLHSMKSAVQRFAGMMSTSQFATLVEDAMSLDKHGCVTGGTQTRGQKRRDPTSRMIASPYAIADALYELLEISRDDSKTQQVQFVGCADALNLGVIAHYLIDLPMEVYRYNAGSLEAVDITTSSVGVKPRVVVLYSESELQENTRSITHGRTVYLHQMTNIVKDNTSTNFDILLAGRIAWERVLSKTFPDSFKQLIGPLHMHFAAALGSAARIFQGLAEGDPSVPQEWLTDCRTYSSQSFGAEYIHFAETKLPELKGLWKKPAAQSHISNMVHQSYKEAEIEFEKTLSFISASCNCKTCSLDGKPDPQGYTKKFDKQDDSRQWYCLTALTTTIIRLIRVLSGIETALPRLYPARAGVEWLFNQQKLRHQRQRQKSRTGTSAQIEYFVQRVLDRNPRGDKYATDFSPLTIAAVLFSGELPKSDTNSYTSAITSKGICAYYRILDDPSRQANIAGHIRVIPGAVEHNGNQYNAVYDFGLDPYKDKQTFVKVDIRPPESAPKKTKELVSQCDAATFRLALREYLGDTSYPVLEVGFTVQDKEKKETLEWFGPARIVDNILRGTGLTMCDGPRCSEEPDDIVKALQAAFPQGSPTADVFQVLTIRHAQVTIFRGDKTTALIAACGCWIPLLLADEDCLRCAVRTGLANSWTNFAIICSEKSYVLVRSPEI